MWWQITGDTRRPTGSKDWHSTDHACPTTITRGAKRSDGPDVVSAVSTKGFSVSAATHPLYAELATPES